jgi:hypothetical protein
MRTVLKYGTVTVKTNIILITRKESEHIVLTESILGTVTEIAEVKDQPAAWITFNLAIMIAFLRRAIWTMRSYYISN